MSRARASLINDIKAYVRQYGIGYDAAQAAKMLIQALEAEEREENDDEFEF